MASVRLEAVLIGVVGVAALGAAVAAVVAWGNRRFTDDPPARDDALGLHVRWWLRLVAVAAAAGLPAGLLVGGFGGRLAMRIIAATSSAGVQGRITEADEVVGEITLGGTIGFLIFVGLSSGVLAGLLHLVLRPLLPGGRAGGLLFGALLLIGGASRLDPLRADNPDFDIVGPDLLSIVMFGALPVLLGMTTASLAAYLSGRLPLIDRRPTTWLWHLPMVPLFVIGPVGIGLLVVGALVVGVRRTAALHNAIASPRTATIARGALLVAALVALPGFLVAVADIATG